MTAGEDDTPKLQNLPLRPENRSQLEPENPNSINSSQPLTYRLPK